MGLLLVTFAGCGPAVSLGDSSSGATESTADDGSTSGGNVPTTSATVTTSPPPVGSTGAPESCFVGQIRVCTCPDGTPGEQECGPDRVFESCDCGGGGSSSWGGSGSSGGWPLPPDIPELPPGEVCLPPSLPCSGNFQALDDAQAAAFGICSVIEGTIFFQENVSTLAHMTCLSRVEGVLVLDNTQVLDLSGLEGLESVESLAFGNNTQLISLDLPNLTSAVQLIAVGNLSLVELQLGNLGSVEQLEFTDNPLLPDCMVTELIAQTTPQTVNCSGNLDTGCADICG